MTFKKEAVRRKFSFIKKDHILKHQEFREVFKSGKRVHTDCFIAEHTKNIDERNRLGLTVSKKVGGAVVRNRIKRLVREHFRLNRYRFSGFWDINIIAKKKAGSASSKEMLASLEKAFIRF